MRLVVGHELDDELVPRGDHGSGSDLAAELARLGVVVGSITHLHVVIPGRPGTGQSQ